MSIPLHITQTNKPNGKVAEVRVEFFVGYVPSTAIITSKEARWFIDNETAYFFTKIAGTSEPVPVTKYGDDSIRSLKNNDDDDNLLNLPDIGIEPGIRPFYFRELQDWVKQMGESLDLLPTF